MKISLVTNKSLKQLNDLIWIENKMLRANNAKIMELCGIKDKQIAELLKDKEILAYRAASAFLGKDKKDSEHENKQVNL